MIVESNPRLRVGLIAEFAARELTASVAVDGRTVLYHLARSRTEGPGSGGVDVVVVDVNSPGCSGLDILATVREHSWPVGVVLTAGRPGRTLRAEVLRMGALALLEKPATVKQWARLLAALIRA
jgi:two-component system response regulator TctD